MIDDDEPRNCDWHALDHDFDLDVMGAICVWFDRLQFLYIGKCWLLNWNKEIGQYRFGGMLTPKTRSVVFIKIGQ